MKHRITTFWSLVRLTIGDSAAAPSAPSLMVNFTLLWVRFSFLCAAAVILVGNKSFTSLTARHKHGVSAEWRRFINALTRRIQTTATNVRIKEVQFKIELLQMSSVSWSFFTQQKKKSQHQEKHHILSLFCFVLWKSQRLDLLHLFPVGSSQSLKKKTKLISVDAATPTFDLQLINSEPTLEFKLIYLPNLKQSPQRAPRGSSSLTFDLYFLPDSRQIILPKSKLYFSANHFILKPGAGHRLKIKSTALHYPSAIMSVIGL